MMTYTAYDPETLEQWCSDKTNFQLFDSALQDYLQIFSDQFHAKSQKKYFSTLIKGFFSPLDRKSLEPIALQFLGEDSVRSLQQFYSRSPLPDQQLMDTYQQRLSSMLDTPNGMLSVDECGFPKKGTHSVGESVSTVAVLVKRKTARSASSLLMPGITAMAWLTANSTSHRSGLGHPMTACVKNAASHRKKPLPQRTRLHWIC